MQNVREFHAHEKATHKEGNDDADKCHGQQKYSVQAWS